VAAAAALAAAFAHGGAASARDDTAALQAKLDAGGKIFLPKLAGGACYQTLGLWVSRSKTTIDSDGACIDYLGPGPTRLTSDDGDPIPANAILFVNRSSRNDKAPDHISISNLTLNVPPGTDGYGVLVAGVTVTLAKLDVEGAPLDGITITGRANGKGYAGPVKIRTTRVAAARRNGISIVGAVGVTIDSSSVAGAGTSVGAESGPWAGIDVEPDVKTYPIRKITVSRTQISANGGAGVLLALATNDGLPQTADQIKLTGNTITGNAAGAGPFLRGGVCLQGGQANGKGRLTLTSNRISGNGGWGLCKHPDGFVMRVTLSRNSIFGNELGDSQW
jgi:parallel beta helix pectate lyase-like protein